jgi:hypothetical protein
MVVAFVASVASGLWPPRRLLRRAQSERHKALREYATQFEWSIVALTASFADAFPVPPLAGAWSAQADLAIGGCVSGWALTVALVSARMHGEQRSNQLALVTVLDFGADRRQFVATRTLRGVDVVSLARDVRGQTAEYDVVLDVLGESPAFVRGDSVALAEVQLVHVRPLRPRQKSLPVSDATELLARLATAMAPGRHAELI